MGQVGTGGIKVRARGTRGLGGLSQRLQSRQPTEANRPGRHDILIHVVVSQCLPVGFLVGIAVCALSTGIAVSISLRYAK